MLTDPAAKRAKARGREWHAAQKDRWTQVHSNDVITSLERDVFPVSGSQAIIDIDESLVLAVLKPVEGRGGN